MSRSEATKIAEDISNQDLLEMFKRAKDNITDWTQVSRVNKSLSKGINWNILAKVFDINHEYHILAKINMVREFGEYLSDNLKPVKKVKSAIKVNHQEPDFSNYKVMEL